MVCVIQLWMVFYLATGISCQGPPPTYSTALETELRTLLFTDYEVLQRPSQTVDVYITFNLFTVNSLVPNEAHLRLWVKKTHIQQAQKDLLKWSSSNGPITKDIKTQTLSTAGYFTMTWTDNALAWNTLTNYSNVRFLFSSEDYMWRPAVVIENSVSELEVFSDEDTLIRISSTGEATWSPGGVFDTYCEADTTYYPLDTQECSVILSTWAYTSNEVTLKFARSAFDLLHFRENGEWTLLSTSTYIETTSRESQEYSRLYYIIKLRRRSVFHVLNTLFPVILMASLVVYVFRLPPQSGERIGMSLTVLLTYAVYLTLIAETIPQTSIHTSVLSVYLTIILILSTFSVIFTIYVLSIYFMPKDDPVPSWLQKFTSQVLVKIACHRRNTCKPSRVRSEDGISASNIKLENMELQEEKGHIKPVRENTLDSRTSDEHLYSPQEIAVVIDKCLMRIYAVVIFLCTFICCLLMVINYNS